PGCNGASVGAVLWPEGQAGRDGVRPRQSLAAGSATSASGGELQRLGTRALAAEREQLAIAKREHPECALVVQRPSLVDEVDAPVDEDALGRELGEPARLGPVCRQREDELVEPPQHLVVPFVVAARGHSPRA